MAIGPVNSINTQSFEELGGFGCNYDEDITSLQESESPNAINIEFDETVIRKRPGYRSITSSVGSNDKGYESFNFGNDAGVQKLITHQGDTVHTLDNLEGAQTAIRTGVPRVQSFMSEVARFLIHTFDDNSTEYYWDGTAGSMTALSGRTSVESRYGYTTKTPVR
jgi:hypothetical protein